MDSSSLSFPSALLVTCILHLPALRPFIFFISAFHLRFLSLLCSAPSSSALHLISNPVFPTVLPFYKLFCLIFNPPPLFFLHLQSTLCFLFVISFFFFFPPPVIQRPGLYLTLPVHAEVVSCQSQYIPVHQISK